MSQTIFLTTIIIGKYKFEVNKNPLAPYVTFSYPLKTVETMRFSEVFRGIEI